MFFETSKNGYIYSNFQVKTSPIVVLVFKTKKKLIAIFHSKNRFVVILGLYPYPKLCKDTNSMLLKHQKLLYSNFPVENCPIVINI